MAGCLIRFWGPITDVLIKQANNVQRDDWFGVKVTPSKLNGMLEECFRILNVGKFPQALIRSNTQIWAQRIEQRLVSTYGRIPYILWWMGDAVPEDMYQCSRFMNRCSWHCILYDRSPSVSTGPAGLVVSFLLSFCQWASSKYTFYGRLLLCGPFWK